MRDAVFKWLLLKNEMMKNWSEEKKQCVGMQLLIRPFKKKIVYFQTFCGQQTNPTDSRNYPLKLITKMNINIPTRLRVTTVFTYFFVSYKAKLNPQMEWNERYHIIYIFIISITLRAIILVVCMKCAVDDSSQN